MAILNCQMSSFRNTKRRAQALRYILSIIETSRDAMLGNTSVSLLTFRVLDSVLKKGMSINHEDRQELSPQMK